MLAPTAILGFLLWRADKRLDARDATFAAEREAWREERAELNTRLQAPERAATMNLPEPSEEPLYIDPDDDEAWQQYRDDRLAGLVN